MTSTTLSPHVRIAALVGVLLVALIGSAVFVLHGGSKPAVITKPPTNTHPTHPSTKPVHVVKPIVNPLLPARVGGPLEHSKLVVVGFFNPNARIDRLPMDEAKAGAAMAHVPFVSVNLLNDSIAGPLTALLPENQILPNPGIAIYDRSGTILFRGDGYLSRAAIAQAVKESR